MERPIDLLRGQFPFRDSGFGTGIAFCVVENDDRQRTSKRNESIASVARFHDDQDAIVAGLLIEIASARVERIDMHVRDPRVFRFEQHRAGPDGLGVGNVSILSRACASVWCWRLDRRPIGHAGSHRGWAEIEVLVRFRHFDARRTVRPTRAGLLLLIKLAQPLSGLREFRDFPFVVVFQLV